DRVSINHLVCNYPDQRLSKITPQMIEEYKRKRLNEVSPATINRELSCLSHLFSMAVKWGVLSGLNPMKDVKLFREKRRELRILKPEEIQRLINNAAEHLKPILYVLILAGLRRNEALRLRWTDIDFDNRRLHIRDSKSGRSRIIPMSRTLYDVFCHLHKRLSQINNEGDFVFTNPETKNRYKDLKRSFNTACRRAGFPSLRMHDLRHFFSSVCLEAGASLATVSELLGHASISTTMIYIHIEEENKRKAVEGLDLVFENNHPKIEPDGTNMAQVPLKSDLIN
ncbi:MAG: tyrosine-type recombinase/integrase, partial [Candidatus Aminicenantes bacterium]|nr:tyrosine-type recombinase/integrase [Candidatus Aminicenantes bacterium]